jgi:hypothetical protein
MQHKIKALVATSGWRRAGLHAHCGLTGESGRGPEPHRRIWDQTASPQPVSRLSAAIPHAASRRITALRLASPLSRGDVVARRVGEGGSGGGGWHGMQEATGMDWPCRTRPAEPVPCRGGPGRRTLRDQVGSRSRIRSAKRIRRSTTISARRLALRGDRPGRGRSPASATTRSLEGVRGRNSLAKKRRPREGAAASQASCLAGAKKAALAIR